MLVAYGTKTDCTAGVAVRIANTLVAMGLQAELRSILDDPDPSPFDAVIVGSGVRVKRWHLFAHQWVDRNSDVLRTKPLAMFTVGLALVVDPGKADEMRAYTDHILEENGVKPVDIGLFNGCFDPTRFTLVERMVLRGMGAPEGDFRDWPAIEAWARKAGAMLGLVTEPAPR